MALIPRVDAAIRLGVSLELLEWFTTNSPKGNGRTLSVKSVEGEPHYADEDLVAFHKYLHSPWPRPPSGNRPHIPSALKEDIRAECHYACAICGLMNGGEVAHVDAVAATLNNGPDNLVLLCPNHHTQYDNGYCANNNVTRLEILAAKAVKRSTRRRLMKVEANATKYLTGLMQLLKQLESKLSAKETTKEEAAVYTTEVKRLLAEIPETSARLQEMGRKDQGADELTVMLSAKAPQIAKLAVGPMPTESNARSAAKAVVAALDQVLVDLDEVECPHCAGRGQVGLVGDLCRYCGGACVVSTADAEKYDRSEIDEVECPRCHGRGLTGVVGDLCAYCRGSCVIPAHEAEAYDEGEIDETECPRCHGRGTTGLVNDACAFCRGSCFVSREAASSYDESALDETECPHCGGRGQIGLSGHLCAFCGGACFVPREVAATYDPEQLDEETCPRCQGKGTIGFSGDVCKLCRGATVVAHDVARAYEDKYGR